MMALGAFLLLTLGAARVTRLLCDDTITTPLRRWIVKRSGVDGWWTQLIHCPWCISVWVSVPASVYWILIAHMGWWWLPPAIPAMAFLIKPVLFLADREG
jgi:hypothetical protein